MRENVGLRRLSTNLPAQLTALDQSRIKDLRTNIEIGNTQGVLDGDLDPFISASLKQGV